MDIDIRIVIFTLIIFFFKLLSVVLITLLLNRNVKRWSNWTIAWMTFYLYEIAIMSVLSVFKRLYAWEMFIVWGVGIAFLIFACLFGKKKETAKVRSIFLCSVSDVIPLTIMAAFVIYCIVRSFVYFDTTPDATAYGMPRIFIFSTQGSLFTNYNTLSKNIFVNEWNGELNAVFYRVLSGNNISIPFANVEIYFYAMLSFIFVGKDLFKSTRHGIYLSYIVMFLPVVVFLSYTCKGDLLAMVVFPLFIFMLLLYWKEERSGTDNANLLWGGYYQERLLPGQGLQSSLQLA